MTWQIVQEVSHKKRRFLEVVCDCGYTGLRRKDWVLSGRSTCCKRCSAKQTAKDFGMPNNSKLVGLITGTFFWHIRNNATRRSLSFEVTQEDLMALWDKQDGRCALTGQPLCISTKIVKHAPDYENTTASLDRIDSSLGYTKDNIQWVHKEINRFKNNYSMEQFKSMCKLVTDYLK